MSDFTEPSTGGSCPCGCGGGPLSSQCLRVDRGPAVDANSINPHIVDLSPLYAELTRLRRERDQLRGILLEIARRECGIPGHSVAVGCGCPELAREILDATTPEEAPE